MARAEAMSAVGRRAQVRVALGAATLLAVIFAGDVAAAGIDPRTLSGGEGTVFRASREAFSAPLANLDPARLRAFALGRHLFRHNWVIAPASAGKLDGLGPLFNRTFCAGCHLKDGRGRPPPAPDQPMKSMLIRLSVPGTGPHGEPIPHPIYGGQLQDKGIPGVPKEGRAVIRYRELPGRFADGDAYALRAPIYDFVELNYGPLGAAILFSPRVAPAIYGLGLLEAVDAAMIRARADPDDRDGDGISGRANRVWDAVAKRPALGRFGWKANVAGLRQQVASAARADIGVTTSLFAAETCTAVERGCRTAPGGGAPELDDARLDKLVLYVRGLAVPARRRLDEAAVRRGERLFAAAGCTGCHLPTLTTGSHPDQPAVSRQTIHPYTDLLLHDMGPGLADGRPDFAAGGREWRTPPLWGIGLVARVNRHSFFLHDGRARNLLEAVMWHGGEGEAAREAVRAMARSDRAALIAFLESL